MIVIFQQKQSPWEGAVRSAGAIWSPLLQSRERTSNQLFHISDWLPTFGLDIFYKTWEESL